MFRKPVALAAMAAVAFVLISGHARAAPTLYVANSGSGTLSVYDIEADGTATPQNPATVSAGAAPQSIAVLGRALFATSGAPSNFIAQYSVAPDGSLTPMNPPTVATSGSPWGIEYDGSWAFVTIPGNDVFSLYTSDSITPLTPVGGPVSSGPSPRGIARGPGALYVANSGGATLSQFDFDSLGGGLGPLTPPTAAAGANPYAVVLSPDFKSAYAANSGDDTISQYHAGPSSPLAPKSPATVPAGDQPRDIAFREDGKSAYVANYGAGTVSQYDVDAGGRLTAKSPATVAADAGPVAIALSDNGEWAYVANESGEISQYSIADDGRLTPATPASFTAGTAPADIAFRADTAPPTVQIDSGPSGEVASSTAEFTFSSSERGSTFICILDSEYGEACTSPKAYTGLAPGPHSFAVETRDFSGNGAEKVATRDWTVLPSPSPPSNDFSFSSTRKRHNGTAELGVLVPGPGVVEVLRTRKVRPRIENANAAGEVTLLIRPRGIALDKVRERGFANVSPKVVFTPDGGAPKTKRTDIRLIER